MFKGKVTLIFAALTIFVITTAFIFSHTVFAKAENQIIARAQEFQLINQAGVTRASLSLSSKGDLLVALHDNQGKLVDILLVTPELIASSKATATRLQKLERIMSKIMPGM